MFTRHVIFLTILSYVGNRFTSRRPRCKESFLLKGWGGGRWEQLFRTVYTGLQPAPVNPAAGPREPCAGRRGTLLCRRRLLPSGHRRRPAQAVVPHCRTRGGLTQPGRGRHLRPQIRAAPRPKGGRAGVTVLPGPGSNGPPRSRSGRHSSSPATPDAQRRHVLGGQEEASLEPRPCCAA